MGTKRSLYVAGSFDRNGGRYSRIGEMIYENLGLRDEFDYMNGGHYSALEDKLESISDYRLVFWFADVPNEEEKLISRVKALNQSCILVTSKRNIDEKYSFADLVFHALRIHSNLAVEFSRQDERYVGRVFDPLGNVFLDRSDDFTLVGRVLGRRAEDLAGYTRVGSKSVGGIDEEKKVPDEDHFFGLTRAYAERFHKLVHASKDAKNRFFGNASFRCEKGFPSFRKDDLIYVSRRNTDKRHIGKETFVPVKLCLPIEYFGLHKPSVDTPIQVKLYQHYKDVNYMLHSHVYIENAPFTKEVIPCGSIEEFDEIRRLYPDKSSKNIAINLKGHGSLVLAENPGFIETIRYVPRKIPEVQGMYRDQN